MHSFEEIREVAIDILVGREAVGYEPSQFESLKSGVAEVFCRREGGNPQVDRPRLNAGDAELVRDVFWDLFRQGFITLGLNDNNQQYPFFRLSHSGRASLENNTPYRFSNATTYIEMVRNHVPDLDDTTEKYLGEAVESFYSGCMLAACVMLGVATENRFLRLLQVASQSPTYGERLRVANDERTILAKITKLTNLLQNIRRDLPPEVREDLETNFTTIQSVIRTFRNEAGHPTGRQQDREQVFVLLQLFAHYAKKMDQIEEFLRDA